MIALGERAMMMLYKVERDCRGDFGSRIFREVGIVE